MKRVLILLVIFSFVACAAALSFPTRADECSSDADCGFEDLITSGEHTCCALPCEPGGAAAKTWLQAVRTACGDRTRSSVCKSRLAVPCVALPPQHVACQAGHCDLVPSAHQ